MKTSDLDSFNTTAPAGPAPDQIFQQEKTEESGVPLPDGVPPDNNVETPAETEYVTGLPFYILFGTLALAALLSAINASMLGTATPSITSAFHSIKDVGWYGSAYLISNSAMMPLTGKIFAIFPLKHAFISFIAIFELGNLIAGVATSSPMLIVGRAICGVGGSGILTGATAVIAIIRPLEKRPMLIGFVMGIVALGQVAGPLLGGILAEVTWRWIFFINLPLGGIVILLLAFVARLPQRHSKRQLSQQHSDDEQPGEHHADSDPPTVRQRLRILGRQLAAIDFAGFGCFAAACALLLMGLEWGGTSYAWDSAVVIGLICGGVGLFAVWTAWSSWMGDRALLPFRLLRHSRINVFCGITALTQSASVFILTYYLPIWFQGIKGASPIMSGVMLLPTILSQLFASFYCGFLVQKTGYYLPELVFGNSMVAVASGLFTTFDPDTPAGKWIGYQIMGGVGRGFVMQLLVTVIQANVPAADVPLGISYVMFAQYFGGAIFICAARTILSSSLNTTLSRYAPSVDPKTVIDIGVTELRTVISADDISGVILAYNESLVDVFLGVHANDYLAGQNAKGPSRERADIKAQRDVRTFYDNRCVLTGTIKPQGAHIVPVRSKEIDHNETWSMLQTFWPLPATKNLVMHGRERENILPLTHTIHAMWDCFFFGIRPIAHPTDPLHRIFIQMVWLKDMDGNRVVSDWDHPQFGSASDYCRGDTPMFPAEVLDKAAAILWGKAFARAAKAEAKAKAEAEAAD